jgi:hypothetical protein
MKQQEKNATHHAAPTAYRNGGFAKYLDSHFGFEKIGLNVC